MSRDTEYDVAVATSGLFTRCPDCGHTEAQHQRTPTQAQWNKWGCHMCPCTSYRSSEPHYAEQWAWNFRDRYERGA